ncbi:alpha-glucosidase [compost metagenome]
MAVWRGLGFTALVLLGVLVAALRTMDARRERPVTADLHVPPAFAVAREFDFGRYRLSWRGQAFQVHPRGRPEKVLWGAAGGFLAAGIGRAEDGGRWRGGELRDRRELLCREQSLEAFERLGSRLLLKGHLRCTDGSLSTYALTLQDDGERGLVLSVTLGEPRLNRLYLAWHRDTDERFFGFGERSGAYDLSGRRLAIAGAGSQQLAATEADDRNGGAPLGFYFTSRMRAFYSQSAAYQVFDLRDLQRVGLEVHEGRLQARIYNGDSQEVLLARQASVVGALPMQPASK